MTLPPSSLQLEPQPLTRQLRIHRRGRSEEALTSLLRGTGLLDETFFLEEERRSWGHADTVEVERGPRRSRRLAVVVFGVLGIALLGRAGVVAR